MVKVELHIEGGGDSRSLQIECRRGFRMLLEKAGFKGRMPSTNACGSRNSAFDDFQKAMKRPRDGEYPILLVDSESAVSEPAWRHLRDQDGWPRPDGAADDQAQLMVQCMETWCVADHDALKRVFGQRLQDSALPARSDLEGRSKDDVQQALERATHNCGRDRKYEKGKRSFRLIAELDPSVLKEHLPRFAELCRTLEGKLGIEQN